MNAKVRNFLQKKDGFFIDFFYIRSQRSGVSSQNFFVSLHQNK